jgi:acyl-CoA synthetase (AMP-forming)/AMP-acid ligase II
MPDFDFATVDETIAAAIPDREALVWRDRRITRRQLAERSRRFANALLARGLRVHAERSELAGHESGQDHLAVYLYNGNEYVEAMLGAWKARVAPLNVNYRYVAEELTYLFQNSRAKAVIYQAEFAPNIAAIRGALPELTVLIQVADDSGNALLPGAVDYEHLLATSPAAVPGVGPSPDDLYILYTGGTTGMPKGVLWRSADIYASAMGGRKPDGSELASREEIAAYAKNGPGLRCLIGPPLMHGAAQWGLFINLGMGNTCYFANENKKLDPADFLATIEREKINSMTIVGDAFARPLLDEMARRSYDLSSLLIIGSGGAPLSALNKREFLERVPQATVLDSIGSSETGMQASNPSNKQTGVSTGDFRPLTGAGVVSADLTRVLAPGDDDLGWFAQKGRVPLGYFGDAAKTAKTFPVIAGVRWSVPGDRARYRPDGTIEVLGRDSVTINSGGEKIFAEEVEHALKHHPAVFDAVVAGRPSERWGQEVVAIVQLRPGVAATPADLLAECAKHLARYKHPKQFVFRDQIQRSPSGKADYRWAKAQAEAG